MSRFEEVVADALTTVRLIPRWDIEEGEWTAVQDGLERLGAAIATGDARGVRMALEDVEAHGPTRLAAIPRESGTSDERRQPPPAVLDIVNTLVHPSTGWSGSSPSGTSQGPGPGA